MTMYYSERDEKHLEKKAEERAEKAAAGDPDAIEQERIWKLIKAASEGNGAA